MAFEKALVYDRITASLVKCKEIKLNRSCCILLYSIKRSRAVIIIAGSRRALQFPVVESKTARAIRWRRSAGVQIQSRLCWLAGLVVAARCFIANDRNAPFAASGICEAPR